ncbi:MAG: hypothetical protein O2816_02385 [Planctomycetota bacterium]|nr:hypothetical protein [Planctomycetota bacterium]
MATILRHRESGERYILIGSGLGMFRSVKPHWFFGNMGQEKQEGVHPCVAVSDAAGKLRWFDSEDMELVSVNGMPPAEALAGA